MLMISTSRTCAYPARVPKSEAFSTPDIFENMCSIENSGNTAYKDSVDVANQDRKTPRITARESRTMDAPNTYQPGGRDIVAMLRSDIVSSVHAPETRLKFAELTKTYSVGIGTLREALSQLVSEGFVTVETGKGFKVAPVSAEELIEITEHFIEFERRAVTESISVGDDDWESNIVATHHRLSIIESLPWAERMERHSEWVERHRSFHESLVSACRGRWLFRLRSIMFDQLDRYRFVSKNFSEGMGRRKFDEHRDIMQATIDRDAEKAARLIEEHVRDTSDRALAIL